MHNAVVDFLYIFHYLHISLFQEKLMLSPGAKRARDPEEDSCVVCSKADGHLSSELIKEALEGIWDKGPGQVPSGISSLFIFY